MTPASSFYTLVRFFFVIPVLLPILITINSFCRSNHCCLAFATTTAMSLAASSSNKYNNSNNTDSNANNNRRPLPDRLLIGYTTQCSPKVEHAVRNGVNVVIWAFCEMMVLTTTTTTKEEEEEKKKKNYPKDNDASSSGSQPPKEAKCTSRFDRDCAKKMIAKLDAEGYHDTIHLVSFGGWNGPHFPDDDDDTGNADDMYRAWKEHCGDIFHGVDWDLEGHDTLDSPTNVFSKRCLDSMGRFSELAKQDGYIIGMAPPQSYLDVSTSHFSRYVNLTDDTREWHKDFHYFGANVYAYLLANYGDVIDFVSIQFYESYSRAGMQVYHDKVPPDVYLQDYVQQLAVTQSESFFVDFEQDPSLDYPSGNVHFPVSKLVLGFANGWAPAAGAAHVDDSNEKVCYFEPSHIKTAYKRLRDKNIAPRGLMYWVIDEDGNKGIDFAKDLNDILNIRKAESCNSAKLSAEII